VKGKITTKTIVLLALVAALLVLTGLSAMKSQKGNQTISQGGPIMVKLETSKGDIVIELNEEKAPKTTENFLAYVKEGFYDGTLFHRVIDNFMIQGGGFDEAMNQKETHDPIENEADNGLKNEAYTIAMARTQDPHSATAQFFINVKDNAFLDHTAPNTRGWGYAVFGKVVEGKEVVDAIKTVATGNAGFHQDVPVEPVVIVKATVID
jgi:peptidyl-prolyl cis-trans isomerase B (cyclophilin B)